MITSRLMAFSFEYSTVGSSDKSNVELINHLVNTNIDLTVAGGFCISTAV